MSYAATAGLILQCFFNAPDISAPPGSIPSIKVPVSAEIAESLRAKQPPLSPNRFAGETAPAREWAFGDSRDPSAAQFKLLRVSLSDAVLTPSPYAARFGIVHRSDASAPRFEIKMSGYCKLLPAGGVQQ